MKQNYKHSAEEIDTSAASVIAKTSMRFVLPERDARMHVVIGCRAYAASFPDRETHYLIAQFIFNFPSSITTLPFIFNYFKSQ